MDLSWQFTRGQPWLVNALVAEVVDNLVPDRSTSIEPRHIERAKEILIERRDTHLDSLIDRLREPRVRRALEPILAGELLPDDDVQFVKDLGLVASSLRGLEISNPIYREIIPRALTWIVQESLPAPVPERCSSTEIEREGRRITVVRPLLVAVQNHEVSLVDDPLEVDSFAWVLSSQWPPPACTD